MSSTTVAEATNFVVSCINRSKAFLPDYWRKTLVQRLAASAAGSCYTQFNSPEELEAALCSCEWEETSHPDVAPGCRVFKTMLPGCFGLIRIADLPGNQTLVADDRKATGRISATVSGFRGISVQETFLICGQENSEWVCFTFHPGKPIRPSQVESQNWPHGCIMTRDQALDLGLEWAKIV